MAGQDDDESDEDLRKELIDARDNLSRQLDALTRTNRRDWTPDCDDLKATLSDELQQVETELAKYADPSGPTDGGDPEPAAGDPEADAGSASDVAAEREGPTDPASAAPTPIQFHTDAPNEPPENGQFWTFAGMGIVALLALGLLLRIFSMLWAHLMGHPAG